ncbi:iron-containing alcohol dehydrogenase [Desulfotomaculum sp. 1211_IL3151]|uniref:iron-containing alcohol dehydrogenase n=1 Tax=Desulfotomaculum sp. 1211_IL3151 TaxID=3084055 RepID=UPI002FD8D8D8
MMVSSFTTPTKIISGVDSRKTLGKEVRKLGGNVVFVCTDRGIINTGLLVDILDSLSKENLAYVIYEEVESNPSIETVESGLNIYRNEQCDVLVAVGGGSVIDTAKAICGLVNKPALSDFCQGIEERHRVGSCSSVIAVPTAAGTGSEVLGGAIIADKQKNCKICMISPWQAPSVAILDPIMLQTLPANIAAATGMVTLTHAIEGYVSLGASMLTDLLNLRAIQLVAKYLRRFIANRKDLEAGVGMQNACLFSAMGSYNSGLGNVYAMANSLLGHYNIHHGVACAVMLPAVMKFNSMASPEKFIEIAKSFGEPVDKLPMHEASLRAVHAVKSLAQSIGIPERLRDVGITTDQIEQMALQVTKSEIQATNPRETNLQDVMMLYRESI